MIQKVDNTGQIEIIIKGRKGNFDLSPDHYDIREIIEVLLNAEALLFPAAKRERPPISYQISEGSVRHLITTTLQAVIGFNAVLAQINAEHFSLDFLELPTARAFEYFQNNARKNDYSYTIKTSVSGTSSILITKETKFTRTEEVWADAEMYFYGTIVDAGGKGKANIHLDTKEFGLLKVESSKELLTNFEGNPLYKSYGVRARGKQNIRSGEVDKDSLHLLEIIDYNPSFKEDYIQSLIKKAKKSWADTPDADEWLQTLRGHGA